MGLQHAQIGEVAERTGLSLRTIRYYEEVGLLSPSGRTAGGFRLYADSDVVPAAADPADEAARVLPRRDA